MDTQELHRGRLIDHIQLVVRDLPASQAFYGAVFEVLQVPMGGSGLELVQSLLGQFGGGLMGGTSKSSDAADDDKPAKGRKS